jgi:hypothetical protein
VSSDARAPAVFGIDGGKRRQLGRIVRESAAGYQLHKSSGSQKCEKHPQAAAAPFVKSSDVLRLHSFFLPAEILSYAAKNIKLHPFCIWLQKPAID